MIAFLEALHAAKHPEKPKKEKKAEDTQVHGVPLPGDEGLRSVAELWHTEDAKRSREERVDLSNIF